jgi:hypothetical protein
LQGYKVKRLQRYMVEDGVTPGPTWQNHVGQNDFDPMILP